MKKGYKRKYLVNGRYQIPQALAVLLANVLALLLAVAVLAWFYLLVWDGSLAVSHNNVIPMLVGCCLVILFFSSAYFSIRRSRKIAGMMKKLNMVLHDASLGEIPNIPLAFRKSDYFKEIETPLNLCLLQLKLSHQGGTHDVLQKIQGISRDLDGGVVTEKDIQKRIQKIADEMTDL